MNGGTTHLYGYLAQAPGGAGPSGFQSTVVLSASDDELRDEVRRRCRLPGAPVTLVGAEEWGAPRFDSVGMDELQRRFPEVLDRVATHMAGLGLGRPDPSTGDVLTNPVSGRIVFVFRVPRPATDPPTAPPAPQPMVSTTPDRAAGHPAGPSGPAVCWHCGVLAADPASAKEVDLVPEQGSPEAKVALLVPYCARCRTIDRRLDREIKVGCGTSFAVATVGAVVAGVALGVWWAIGAFFVLGTAGVIVAASVARRLSGVTDVEHVAADHLYPPIALRLTRGWSSPGLPKSDDLGQELTELAHTPPGPRRVVEGLTAASASGPSSLRNEALTLMATPGVAAPGPAGVPTSAPPQAPPPPPPAPPPPPPGNDVDAMLARWPAAPAGSCDICGVGIDGRASHTVSATEFKGIVAGGYNPFASGRAPRTYALMGLDESTAYRDWLLIVNRDSTDWGLCPACARDLATFAGTR